MDKECCYCKNKEWEVGTTKQFYDANSGRWICSNCIGMFLSMVIDQMHKDTGKECLDWDFIGWAQCNIMWFAWTIHLMDKEKDGN